MAASATLVTRKLRAAWTAPAEVTAENITETTAMIQLPPITNETSDPAATMPVNSTVPSGTAGSMIAMTAVSRAMMVHASVRITASP